MQGTTFLSFSSVSFEISFEHAVQLPFTVFLYSPFPDNYAFLSLSPSQIKNIQSADTVPVHGHSPLVELSCSQTNSQTHKSTNKPRQKHNLLGGGNNIFEKNGLTVKLLKILVFDIYFFCDLATNKKRAITHLWHAMEPQTMYIL